MRQWVAAKRRRKQTRSSIHVETVLKPEEAEPQEKESKWLEGSAGSRSVVGTQEGS